jgi:uncharacterized protein YbjT (DUF2867 family)
MKLVVIGGTGLIGSRLVTVLREHGHEAVPASPDTGVNTLTGEGLAKALDGASVVIDVSNSRSFEEAAVMKFFTESTRNLLSCSAAAGVTHYVALSVVGTGRIPDSPYLRAKDAQEALIRNGGIPYSIVQATQFYEFINRIADEATDGTTVRLPAALIQPIAADEVAVAVGRVAVGAPQWHGGNRRSAAVPLRCADRPGTPGRATTRGRLSSIRTRATSAPSSPNGRWSLRASPGLATSASTSG